MIEVSPLLYVGDGTDYAAVAGTLNWAFVQAAKDPWHRKAVGYTTPGAPKNSPEYLWAYRENRLILNMVDADDPKYFAVELVTEALAYIWDNLDAGCRVLVHCNQGESRAPSLALYYLRMTDGAYRHMTLAQARAQFEEIYPAYKPKAGIWGYLEQHWDERVPA